jgi:energy-coupling factor transport system ATP-binding protein
MIAVEGLSFRFQGGREPALSDVSLSIGPDEFVVVAGPSGCGKSTLALAISGVLFRQFEGEAEGTVTVDGMDVRSCPIYDVAEVVGLVQQNPENQFCTLTVQDEVAFGLENRCLPRQEIEERIAWALRIVGGEHLQERLLATLSGGEKQKVAVAAIMAAKPRVLIFDEPTSNLDPTATAEIFAVIAGIRSREKILVIVIEHKVSFLAPFAPRLLAMDGGRIVFDGPMAGVPGSKPEGGGRTQEPGAKAKGAPLVHVEDVSVAQGGRMVLQGISLEVRSGEFVAVMGDNGSGKTTFLLSLLGLLKPDQGCVEVCGQDTRKTPVSRLARRVGFVFQNPDHQLFADSVWEEATFAARNLHTLDSTTEARVSGLLERCGLGDRREEHPYRLSYGQKRRLNLISVLAHGPRLILLDEVLIGQDPASAALILDLLHERVGQGDTVILVNHAPEVTRRYASRILFFDKGRLAVDAPTEVAFEHLQAMGRDAYLPHA